MICHGCEKDLLTASWITHGKYFQETFRLKRLGQSFSVVGMCGVERPGHTGTSVKMGNLASQNLVAGYTPFSENPTTRYTRYYFSTTRKPL